MLDSAVRKKREIGKEEEWGNKNCIRYKILQSALRYEELILSYAGTHGQVGESLQRLGDDNRTNSPFHYAAIHPLWRQTPRDKRMYCCHWQCHYGTVNKRCSGGSGWTGWGKKVTKTIWNERMRDPTGEIRLLLVIFFFFFFFIYLFFARCKAKDGHMLRTKPRHCQRNQLLCTPAAATQSPLEVIHRKRLRRQNGGRITGY